MFSKVDSARRVARLTAVKLHLIAVIALFTGCATTTTSPSFAAKTVTETVQYSSRSGVITTYCVTRESTAPPVVRMVEHYQPLPLDPPTPEKASFGWGDGGMIFLEFLTRLIAH